MSEGQIVRGEGQGTAPDLKPERVDHLWNVLKSVVGALPFGGGILASLMGDFLPKSREKKIEAFLTALADGFERLTEAQAEAVKTDEFAYLFTKAAQSVASEYREEKIAAYRNLLVNALVVPGHEDLVETFLSRLDRMTPTHLLVLHLYAKGGDRSWADEGGIDPWQAFTPDTARRSVDALAGNRRLEGHERSTIAAVFGDLMGMGIVEEVGRPESEGVDLALTVDPQTRLAEYGEAFLRFVDEPVVEAAPAHEGR